MRTFECYISFDKSNFSVNSINFRKSQNREQEWKLRKGVNDRKAVAECRPVVRLGDLGKTYCSYTHCFFMVEN